jgi:hypothetical protein
VTTRDVFKTLHQMHESMHDEQPPNDGHRRAILYPRHTHVGFGIAVRGHNVRLDELYLARYVKVEPIPRSAKIGTSMIVSGKLLGPNYLVEGLEVFYEPLPSPPTEEWLRAPRSYGMPSQSEYLLPRLSGGMLYMNGGRGDIETGSGNTFRVRVRLAKKPGINTMMLWIKTGLNGSLFPATQICVRVE